MNRLVMKIQRKTNYDDENTEGGQGKQEELPRITTNETF